MKYDWLIDELSILGRSRVFRIVRDMSGLSPFRVRRRCSGGVVPRREASDARSRAVTCPPRGGHPRVAVTEDDLSTARGYMIHGGCEASFVTRRESWWSVGDDAPDRKSVV